MSGCPVRLAGCRAPHAVMPGIGQQLSGLDSGGRATPRRHARAKPWHDEGVRGAARSFRPDRSGLTPR